MKGIHVPFNEVKATQAVAYIIQKRGGIFDHYLSHKMLYALDRLSWSSRERPVVGGTYRLYDWGPLIAEQFQASKSPGYYQDHINRSGNQVSVANNPGRDALSDAELTLLDKVIAEWAGLSFNEAHDKAAALPECADVRHRTRDDEIPVEAILRRQGKKPESIRRVADEIAEKNTLSALLRGGRS